MNRRLLVPLEYLPRWHLKRALPCTCTKPVSQPWQFMRRVEVKIHPTAAAQVNISGGCSTFRCLAALLLQMDGTSRQLSLKLGHATCDCQVRQTLLRQRNTHSASRCKHWHIWIIATLFLFCAVSWAAYSIGNHHTPLVPVFLQALKSSRKHVQFYGKRTRSFLWYDNALYTLLQSPLVA